MPHAVKTLLIALTALLLAAAPARPALTPPPPAAGGISVVVYYPGGLEEGPEVEKAIGEFARILARGAGLEPESVRGRYFSELEPALAYLQDSPDSFIVSSLGFYLAQRSRLPLAPLAAVEQASGPNDRYYLAAKKGRFPAASALRGETVSGNTLYEDRDFLLRVVFAGLPAASGFEFVPTSRPLTALRRAARGEIGAALLDRAQYRALEGLPFAGDLEVLYVSAPIPELGLMMVETETTRKLQERFLAGILALSGEEEGRKALEAFGVSGFRAVSPGDFSAVAAAYAAPPLPEAAGVE